jgi:hypothetical protein
MQEGLKDLSIQERSMPTQEVLRKGILTSESFEGTSTLQSHYARGR